MKLRQLLACCCFVSISLTAAEPSEASSPEGLLSKIADAFNAQPPDGYSKLTEKEALEFQRRNLDEAEKLIAEFRNLYPEHPLRWEILIRAADLVIMRDELDLPQAKDAITAVEVYTQIINAKDAPKAIREEASSTRLYMLADEVMDDKMPFAWWEKYLTDHLAAFPEDADQNTQLTKDYIEMVEKKEAGRLPAVLESLLKSPDRTVVAAAQERINYEKARAELMVKPLELKFIARDGSEVDVEKLRGKVVLVHFWASWSKPCMEEMPKVIKIYEKFHGKGLEIISISFDYDDGSLDQFVKDKKIPWPQYYDETVSGRGFVEKYRINDKDIPIMWLINKKGVVVNLNAKDDLDKKIEKLLAE